MCVILYIEKDRETMPAVRQALEARGHRVLWAADGPQGLEMAHRYQPDLILLSLDPPDISGSTFMRRLRADPTDRLSVVPVLAITPNDFRGPATHVLKAGCDYYLNKPLNIRELLAHIRGILSQQCWQREAVIA